MSCCSLFGGEGRGGGGGLEVGIGRGWSGRGWSGRRGWGGGGDEGAGEVWSGCENTDCSLYSKQYWPLVCCCIVWYYGVLLLPIWGEGRREVHCSLLHFPTAKARLCAFVYFHCTSRQYDPDTDQ